MPAEIAVTSPVVGLTVATEVFELLHVPPASPFDVNVAVAAIHSGDEPFTVPAFTFEFTVTVACDETGDPQPDAMV